MNVAPEMVIKEIHLLKPYPAGNDFLHAVKSLDETDKHRNIILVGVTVELPAKQLQLLVAPNPVPAPPDTLIAFSGDFVMNLDACGPVEVFDKEANPQPAITVGLGQVEPLSGMPLIWALTNMTEATEDAIRRLARAFFL